MALPNQGDAVLGLDGIYVINVKAFEARLRSITAQLARLGLQAEIIQDWDPPEITAEIDAQWFLGADLTPAQRSCALKHLEALQRIRDRGQRYALVLEDDALLAPDFCEGIRRALAEAPNYLEESVIFIGSGGNFYTPRSQREPGRSLYPGPRGRFTDSYIIGHRAARRRLEFVATHRISRPIDNEFERTDLACGIQMLWLEDPVVEQGSKNGRFGSAIDRQPPRWMQGLRFYWEKMRRKWLYQLWR